MLQGIWSSDSAKMIENDTAAAEFTQKTEPIDPYALSDGSKKSI